jgi:hypothetical protein
MLKKIIYSVVLTFVVFPVFALETITLSLNNSKPIEDKHSVLVNDARVVKGYIFNTNIGKYVYHTDAYVIVDYYGVHVSIKGIDRIYNAVRTSNNPNFNYCVWIDLSPYGGYWLFFNL